MSYDTPADTLTKTDTQDVPAPGDVILHPVLSHVTDQTREQALVVVGSKTVRATSDPEDERTVVRVHAVPIGWADEMYAVPSTHPVPVVAGGQYADLAPGQYRRP